MGKKSERLDSLVLDSPCSKQTTTSPSNCKSVDFDLILENTGDSIINPSFIDDSPKSAKGVKGTKGLAGGTAATDFSKLSETLAKSGETKNGPVDRSAEIVRHSGISSSLGSSESAVNGSSDKVISLESLEKSDPSLLSPSREKNAGAKHVFTPPRNVASPSRSKTPEVTRQTETP
uniref:Uncharacterized protein n=1 Tax=Cacopsylla melanoneura TaxID=428564 RepID=A0A8D9DWA6_9HEMI